MILGEKEWRLSGAMLLILVLLFVLDLVTPHGFTKHVLYATVVLLATASRRTWMPSVIAGIGTVLTLAGLFLGPDLPGFPMWMVIGNRAFTIAVLWILVWFAWKRRQAESALRLMNENLEQTIAERTRELGSVNQALIAEITERKQTEHAFRASEARLADILDIAEDAIIVIDQDRTIMLFNQGAAKLFGYDPDDVLGQPIDLLLPERFRVGHASHLAEFAQSPDSARRMVRPREVFGLRKDGSEFPAEASVSKLMVEEGTTFTVIVRDITERLRTEQQLQSLTTELITAQEEERRRIARELHDDVNQRLALLAIEMGKIAFDPATMTNRAAQIVQSLAQQLAKISDDVRRMAYQFHPSILDDLGLTTALQQLTSEWSTKTGIKVVVVQEEEMAKLLPLNISSCLYRITQEGLANIMKHARATRVEVELTCDTEEVTLSVYDNGVGFDLKEIQARHPGLGLVNMRERVRSVRGHIDLNSKPGLGTHITVRIPLPGVPDEKAANSFSR